MLSSSVLGEFCDIYIGKSACTWYRDVLIVQQYQTGMHDPTSTRSRCLECTKCGVSGACTRAFSPLEGFMSEQQYLSVVQNMRLPVSADIPHAFPDLRCCSGGMHAPTTGHSHDRPGVQHMPCKSASCHLAVVRGLPKTSISSCRLLTCSCGCAAE